jgi:hypothetical protein
MAEKIHILPTDKTPEVLLDPEGIIKIKGRAIDESRSTMIPERVLGWVDSYYLNPPDITQVIIALEFLNSFNAIVLASILKKIAHDIPPGKKLYVRWYYEEDDVDIFERGEYIANTLKFPVQFILTEKVSGC